MYIILGATGHVGSSVAATLLEKEQEVLVITRSEDKAAQWERKGAKAEIVNVLDTAALNRVLKKGKRLFLLNPPGSPEKDIVAEERATVSSILQALADSPIQKVVAESTYGAQEGDNIGDLGVLYEMEQGLKKTGISSSIIRAAYYMSNWEASLPSMKEDGILYSFFPPEFKFPMVAPSDIGKIAASLLMDNDQGLYYVEGPELYATQDVAKAFGSALQKEVQAMPIPTDQWLSSMKEIGFSEASSNAFAGMTRITMEEKYEKPSSPIRGGTTIQEYAKACVSAD